MCNQSFYLGSKSRYASGKTITYSKLLNLKFTHYSNLNQWRFTWTLCGQLAFEYIDWRNNIIKPFRVISAAQFATAFALRPNLVSWFLGAGASAASGIPTGYSMILDFKAKIFCRETNLSGRDIDTADTIWIDRINAFFRQTSMLPPDGDPSEYAEAFEAVYPEARHRRQYIDDAISKGCPASKTCWAIAPSRQ